MTPAPTQTDDDLRALFAPLAADAPAPAEREALRAALAAAPPAPAARPRARARLTWKPVAAVATATLAVGAGLAILPGDDKTNQAGGGVSILHAAAAEAAGEPVPGVAEAPYRYARLRDTFTYTATGAGGATAELHEAQDSEAWVGAKWTGRQAFAQGRTSLTGDAALGRTTWPDAAAGKEDPFVKARDTAYAYGDGPLAELDPADLPSDRDGIVRVLRDGIENNRWSLYPASRGKPNRSGARPIESFVTYSMLNLLSVARVTPAQRAAMLDVLGRDPSAHDLGTVKDAEGREGRGVTLRYPGEQFLFGANRFEVIFDADSSEILQWSMAPDVPSRGTPARVETVLGGGYVAAIGDRP
jgi:hypothetical protein